MELALTIVYYALFVFLLLLLGRVVIELTRAFSRSWTPTGRVAAVLETVYTATDPPVLTLRRIIPSVPLGNVRLDLSIMVLLLVVFILMQLTLTGVQ